MPGGLTLADALSRSRAVAGIDTLSPASRRGADATATGRIASGVRQTFSWFGALGSFWTVVPICGLIGFIYLYGFTDSLYQSQTILDLQNSGSSSVSLGSLGSNLLGSAGSTTQSGAVVQFIQSPDLLKTLDKQFHLRQIYSDKSHSLFWRLDPDASDEDFLSYFQQMVTVSQDSTTLLITVNVLDYDAQRAQKICQAIVKASQTFVNNMTLQMQIATLKYAQGQLATAMKAVETAQPYERSVAEMELTAAQQALVTAQGLANQQQSFLLPVQVPSYPTDTTDPDRLVDEAAILLASAAFYLAAHLLIANARDHRQA
jgi:capsular polysaccharide transport system permease protein